MKKETKEVLVMVGTFAVLGVTGVVGIYLMNKWLADGAPAFLNGDWRAKWLGRKFK